MSTPPTILVTGATDGLGLALAHRLAEDGATLILHGRDDERLDRAASALARDHTLATPPMVVRADYASLDEVRGLAHRLLESVGRLDVLVNNAGIGGGPTDERQVSADGHELRFAVNHLAGLDLSLRLVPLLRRTPGARIVNVASLSHSDIDFDDVMLTSGYSGARAYGQSKLAQVTAGLVLARKLAPSHVSVNSLHPASYMPTKMVMESIGRSVDTLESGLAATYRVVTDPELDGSTGLFFDRLAEVPAHPTAYDEAVQDRLWQLSLSLTGAPEPSVVHG